MQAVVLALVGIGITIAVYGVVALIVKADDVGMSLAKNEQGSAFGSIGRALGRALVLGMPAFLKFLSAVGTAAMIWVGGGIVLHGLEVYGPTSIGLALDAAAEASGHVLPLAARALQWTVAAAISGIIGLIIGAASIPVVEFGIAPAWKLLFSQVSRPGP
jgi:predicted DNA repair protein MutK